RPRSPPFPYTTLFRSSRPAALARLTQFGHPNGVQHRGELGPEVAFCPPRRSRRDRLRRLLDRRPGAAGALRTPPHVDRRGLLGEDRKSTRLNSSHVSI